MLLELRDRPTCVCVPQRYDTGVIRGGELFRLRRTVAHTAQLGSVVDHLQWSQTFILVLDILQVVGHNVDLPQSSRNSEKIFAHVERNRGDNGRLVVLENTTRRRIQERPKHLKVVVTSELRETFVESAE